MPPPCDHHQHRGAHILPWICSAALLCLLQCVPSFLAGGLQRFFCLPAAHAASWMLNAPLEITDNATPALLLPDRALEIAAQCSGFDFFTISATVLLWFAARRRAAIVCWLAILPLAYAVTISANCARIVALAWFAPFGKILLPANWQAAVHLGIGIGVFLPCLLLLTFLTERKYHAIRQKNQTVA